MQACESKDQQKYLDLLIKKEKEIKSLTDKLEAINNIASSSFSLKDKLKYINNITSSFIAEKDDLKLIHASIDNYVEHQFLTWEKYI